MPCCGFTGGKKGAAEDVAARAAAGATALRAVRNAERPAVVVVEGAESADPEALRDLILVLSEVSRCRPDSADVTTSRSACCAVLP